MRLRSLLFAAVGAGFVLSAAAPAFADRDDWRRHDEHAWHEHAWHEHHDWDRGYYAPPVVVAPAPAYGYGYYTPAPPVVYGPPGVSIGIHLP